jgi:hypothetical protein
MVLHKEILGLKGWQPDWISKKKVHQRDNHKSGPNDIRFRSIAYPQPIVEVCNPLKDFT